MGVQGLLGLAAPASRPVSAAELRGHSVAADAYCWLHRGALGRSPANQLAHVKYCMKYVNMLLSYNIKPILVFDGRHLPAKAITEEKRRESRSLAKTRAAELLRLGKLEEARVQMRRCIDITHEMALDLIKECRKMNVDCIVAPYEADAQLAYLNMKKIADIIITEDSDLLLFGCNKVIFKMDLNGNGVLIESSKLPLIMKCPLEKYSFTKFRQMCILSGCDYLPSLPGIGLVKARLFINATRDPDISNALKKLPTYLNKSALQVTDEYRKQFLIAEATFKHQFVYDPIKRMMVPLTDPDDEGTDPEHCCNAGVLLDPNVAFQLALGNIDPFTLKKMDEWNPDDPNNMPTGGKTNSWTQCSIAPHKSIWNKNYMDSKTIIKEEKNCINALSIPITRPLCNKVINTSVKIDNGMTIKDLSEMYCIEPPQKKKKVIIPETQGFDDSLSDNSNVTSENVCCEDDDNKDTSPILTRNNTTYKRLLENGSFNKFKKISKFKRTILDTSDDVVQSKFFDAFTPESMTDSQKENSCMDEDNKSGILNNIEIDNITDIKINSIYHHKNEDLITDVPVDKIASPLKDSSMDLNNKLSEFSKYESGNDVHSKNPFRVQHSLDKSSNDIFEKSSDNSRNNLQIPLENKNISGNSPINKSNNKIFNACRRPGLHKKKVVPITGQQTLLTVFGFQKKSQLKHANQ